MRETLVGALDTLVENYCSVKSAKRALRTRLCVKSAKRAFRTRLCVKSAKRALRTRLCVKSAKRAFRTRLPPKEHPDNKEYCQLYPDSRWASVFELFWVQDLSAALTPAARSSHRLEINALGCGTWDGAPVPRIGSGIVIDAKN